MEAYVSFACTAIASGYRALFKPCTFCESKARPAAVGYIGAFQLDGGYYVDKREVMPRATGYGLPEQSDRAGIAP